MNVRRGVVGLTLSLALIMADPGGSGISGAAIRGGKVLGSTISGEEPTPYLPGQQETPVVLEVRYRLKGAVRPLLFWIGSDDVGAARLRWRDDQKSRLGYEFLIGSDPLRAPREINRWGWVWEEKRENGATQRGLMRDIDEEAVEEAQSETNLDGEYIFEALRTEIVGGQARAERTIWLVEDNYTYYDLDELLRVVEQPPQSAPRINEGPLPPDIHPGMLFAVADLVERAVVAATSQEPKLLKDVTTHYNFNAAVCDLTLRETKWEDSKEYGGHRYEHLVRMEFENYRPERDQRNSFTLVSGTQDEFRGVPVYIKYQPKWWFRTEGVIDTSQVFERPVDRRTSGSERGVPEVSR